MVMTKAEEERREAAKLPGNDVIGILLTQHARIRDLFARVKGAHGEAKQEAFDELRALLAVHETAEEMIIRPASERVAGKRVAEERNQEEAEANHVLAGLEKMDVNTAKFDAEFADFERSVSDHADQEEREEFPALHRDLDEDQLTTMGKRLLSAEKMAPTHPHPAAAGSPKTQMLTGPFASMVDRVKDAL